MDAAAYITSDDELIGSLEGIECLMWDLYNIFANSVKLIAV